MIPMIRFGYNTNGLAHHRLDEALTLLGNIGYQAVAITPDVGQLDPYRLGANEAAQLRRQSVDLGLALTVETGARFLLDPAHKHDPNLMNVHGEGRERRVDYYRRCIDLAVELGAPLVSLWAGTESTGATFSTQKDPRALLERLAEGLRSVLAHARARGVAIGFEPEPGMFIEGPAGYKALLETLGPDAGDLGLTLDVGHLVVTGDRPEGDVIRAHSEQLVNVHLDDCPVGIHEHRPFGQGDLDLPGVLSALQEVGFQGVASVELSRDSHRGPEAAAEALGALRAALPDTPA